MEVLSPLCGMVTINNRQNYLQKLLVVLSPLCGMVTTGKYLAINSANSCSKPTVWDGDKAVRETKSILSATLSSSKPTVWDGDELAAAG